MRDQRFRPEQVIRAIDRCGGVVTQVAVHLRCQPETVRNYVKRYPAVAEALREARERTLDLAETALYHAIQAGEGWAICFYLKTQGRSRGYTERQELTGKGGAPCEVSLTWTDAAERHQGVDEAHQRRAVNHGGNLRVVGDTTRSGAA